MNKQLNRLLYIPFLCLIMVGCSTPAKPKPAPASKEFHFRAVHNSCTGLWAMRTYNVKENGWVNNIDSGYFGGFTTSMIEMDGNRMNSDSVDFARIGEEYTFKDSCVAVSCFNSYHRKIYIADSLSRMKDVKEKATADSIWKCQHTYQ